MRPVESVIVALDSLAKEVNRFALLVVGLRRASSGPAVNFEAVLNVMMLSEIDKNVIHN